MTINFSQQSWKSPPCVLNSREEHFCALSILQGSHAHHVDGCVAVIWVSTMTLGLSQGLEA